MKKKSILTLTDLADGYGHFPRQIKMMEAFLDNNFDIYWIGPKKIKNNKFKFIKLECSYLPNLAFVGLFIKVFFTIIKNYKKLKSINYCLAIREYDAICLFFNPFLKCKKIFFSRGDRLTDISYNLKYVGVIKKIKLIISKIYFPFIQRIVLKKANINLFQQHFLKKLALNRYPLASFKTFILKNNVVYNKNYKLEKNKTLYNKKIINIGFAAPMWWSVKGLGVMLNIIESFKKKDEKVHFQFNLAGDGPDLQKFKKKLEKNRNVKFYGWVKNIYSFIKKQDIIIIPSKYDNNPNFILECLSTNKILFASNIPAHKEMLKDRRLLFNYKNPVEVKKKIISCVNNKIIKNQIYNIIEKRRKNLTFDWKKKLFKKIINFLDRKKSEKI